MRVFLTGGSGYVGSYVLRALVENDHTACCLVRNSADDLVRTGEHVEPVIGDLLEPHTYEEALSSCDAVIHLVGLLEENPRRGATYERIHVDGTRRMVETARDANIERFIHMSANGARPTGGTAYQRTKWQAEQIVEEAGFSHWTIMRPSILFGKPDPGRPEFTSRLLDDLVRPFPLLPIFGDGSYEMQPIHVTEAASAFVQALSNEHTSGQTYLVAGKTRMPYVDVLDRIARGAGLDPKPKIHLPMPLARLGVYTAGRLGLLPITPDQFEMLIEGNTGDAAPFYRDFDLAPTPFTPENLQYLQSM